MVMKDKLYFEDIIFARATPPGYSAIAVIRVSGNNSWQILSKIFDRDKYKSHQIYHGNIIDNNNIIDNVIVLTFAENKSFTGEESFEINCHGNEVIVSLISNLLIKNSVRIAEPGEFSKRAFLNKKISLAEAESIMDIVHASTEKSALIAVRQLSGRLSGEIDIVKEDISNLLAQIEVDIDYPEEDISFDTNIFMKNILQINNKFDSLLTDFKRGHFFRENIHAVILGKTNSGKSTLFNFLLNEDKAIVSDIHGTTRDYLDAIINIKGYGIRVYDTAGLRKSNDPIEIEGHKRAIDISKNANIILYIISAVEGITDEDKNNINNVPPDKKLLVIINKYDLVSKNNNYINDIEKFVKTIKNKNDIVKISALKKEGLEYFNDAFIKLLTDDNTEEAEDPIITNSRHADLLEKANKNLLTSVERINEELLDLAAFEIREALDRLGEITGEITPTDIINKIFTSFCVGK